MALEGAVVGQRPEFGIILVHLEAAKRHFNLSVTGPFLIIASALYGSHPIGDRLFQEIAAAELRAE